MWHEKYSGKGQASEDLTKTIYWAYKNANGLKIGNQIPGMKEPRSGISAAWAE